MQDEAPEKYQTHFKAWIDAGLDPDGIEDLYKEVCTGSIPLSLHVFVHSHTATPASWYSCSASASSGWEKF